MRKLKLPKDFVHNHGFTHQSWFAGKDDRTFVLMAIDGEHNIEYVVVDQDSDLSMEEISQAIKDYCDFYGGTAPNPISVRYGVIDLKALHKKYEALRIAMEYDILEG